MTSTSHLLRPRSAPVSSPIPGRLSAPLLSGFALQLALAVLGFLLFLSDAAGAAVDRTPVRRFALVAGSNDGGPGRVQLRYAGSDAGSLAKVLQQLGGVAPGDLRLLLEPSKGQLEAVFADLSRQLRAARGGAERLEVIVYYSGHSDEAGLLPQGEPLGYPELRAALAALPADVRVAILDSCASGALTRLKGGRSQPSFLLDSSVKVQGQAILTSASADEAAQESDRIGGSFFTHALVTGLRGAADGQRRGRVTLNDAYQFAFAKTLSRTERTQSGPQHPAYEIQLAGSGDLVMTDLRSTGAGLVLPAELQGRVSVRDAAGSLVVELRKLAGRPIELGLEPGEVRVTVEDQLNLNLGAGRFLSLDGVDLGLGGSIYARDARWLQMNVGLSWVGGDMGGLQSAVGLAWTGGDLRGAQLSAGASVARGAVTGLQGSSGLSWAGRVHGVQAAATVSFSESEVHGVQAASGAAIAGGEVHGFQGAAGLALAGGELHGFQGSAGATWAMGDVHGVQAAAGLTVARNLRGAQVGAVNVARQVEGFQLGVVNVSEDAPVAIGAVSWVTRGQHHVAIAGSELGPSLEGKLGGTVVYTLYSVGVQPLGGSRSYRVGLGLGGHVDLGDRLFLEVEALGHQLAVDGAWHTHAVMTTGRVGLGLALGGGLALVAGGSWNTLYTWDGESRLRDVGFGRLYERDGRSARNWPGGYLALQY